MVPNTTLNLLRALDVELVQSSEGFQAHNHVGRLLRFKVLVDESVTRYLVRDVDARLSRRDKRAFDEWMESGLYFHVMRDHRKLNVPILAGMWGAVGGLIRPGMLEPVMAPLAAEVPHNEDQIFLGNYMWPHIRNCTLTHDSYRCNVTRYRTAAWRPFPTRRLAPQDFPGNTYVYANDFVGMSIPPALQECPEACRFRKELSQC